MSASRRLGQLALVVALGAAAGGLGTAAPAGAAEDDCVESYLSRGRSVVVGPSYSIPYQSIAGAPYVENEMNSRPGTQSFASNAYEGWIGDVVLGTSGVYPRNPMAARAQWPPLPQAEQGGSIPTKDSVTYGPFAKAEVEAGPRSVDGEASAFGERMSADAGIGPSFAASHALFDGEAVRGVDEVVAYDLTFGPLSIKKLRSVIEYEADGTDAGTKVTWLLEFSGVGGDGNKVYSITKDGFAPAGGEPAGGSDEMKAFNDGAEEFAGALEAAGIGRSAAKIAEGSIRVEDGELLVRTAGLQLSMDFAARKDQIGSSQGIFFGFQERYAKVVHGPCAADVNRQHLENYDDPPTGATEVGPVRYPDPTPPGYGGPESTTPAPAPAPLPEPVREVAETIPVDRAADLEVMPISNGTVAAGGPFGVSGLVAVVGFVSFAWAAKSLWRASRPGR